MKQYTHIEKKIDISSIIEGIELIVSLGIGVIGGLLGDHWYRKRLRRLVEEGSVLPEKQRQKQS